MHPRLAPTGLIPTVVTKGLHFCTNVLCNLVVCVCLCECTYVLIMDGSVDGVQVEGCSKTVVDHTPDLLQTIEL
jgi:hypothetical protein